MIVVVIIPLLLLGSLAVPPSTIVLESTAEIAGTRILLRDLIADDNETALSAAMLDLDVGRAPSPAFTRMIDRRLVAELAPNCVVTGADTCAAKAATVTIERGEIERVARELLEKSPLVTGETTIELTRSPVAITVAKGRDSRILVPRLRGKPAARGPVTVQVDIEVDGALVRSSQVGFFLRTKGSFAVLNGDVPRGTALTPERIRWIEIDTTESNVIRVDPELVYGQLARRDLKTGTPLRFADFVSEALVKRGDFVRIVFKRGGLELQGRGIAKSNAAIGESIRVENADSKKPLVGKVAGPGIVVVDH